MKRFFRTLYTLCVFATLALWAWFLWQHPNPDLVLVPSSAVSLGFGFGWV